MEVHSPEHPIHTWRDFFIHIATIVVGLLIAIGLEQSVEWLHHREQVHDAERRLQSEIHSNAQTLDEDERTIAAVRQDVLHDLATLRALREHIGGGSPPELISSWSWDGLGDVAWTTARDTTVVALMPYSTVERLADLYLQQQYVNQAAEVYVADMTRLRGPIQGGRTLTQATPAELDAMISTCQDAVLQINYMHALMRPLHEHYPEATALLASH